MAKVIDFNKQSKGGGVMGVKAMAEEQISDTKNLLTFAKIVLYLANDTSTKLYRTKLHKLLFYVQFTYLKRYNEKLLMNDFICQKYGPVLPTLDVYLSLIEKVGLIKMVSDQHGSFVVPKKKFAETSYNKEIGTIKEVSSKFDTWTAGEISEYSHREPLWKQTRLRHVIPSSKAEELNDL